MYGAWGAATASTGKTFQLRALDWDTDGPFKDYAAVVVYHPSGPNGGNDFANVGFVGWIGALSGQSSAHMAISEIGS
jgi:isopenicillin-N N-acyltransferase like protein